jgi:hypothetical protein
MSPPIKATRAEKDLRKAKAGIDALSSRLRAVRMDAPAMEYGDVMIALDGLADEVAQLRSSCDDKYGANERAAIAERSASLFARVQSAKVDLFMSRRYRLL